MHIRQATLDDLDILVPLFDGYRQFYKQESNIEGARAFLEKRLGNNESVVYIAFLPDTVQAGAKLPEEQIDTSRQDLESNEYQAVGFTQIYPFFSSVSMEPMLVLNDLYIAPGFRGQGVGSALIDSVKNLCRNLDQKGIALQTAYDNPAQKLYEREGFKKDTDLQYFWQLE
jgi:ribosomal protein S18 acetylase RimI-like enzyme